MSLIKLGYDKGISAGFLQVCELLPSDLKELSHILLRSIICFLLIYVCHFNTLVLPNFLNLVLQYSCRSLNLNSFTLLAVLKSTANRAFV